MKAPVKFMLYGVIAIAVMFGFWIFWQPSSETQTRKPKILIAKLPETGKQEVKVDNISKYDAYRKKEEEEKEKRRKLQIELNNVPTGTALNAGMSDALKDESDRKLERAREFKTKASLGNDDNSEMQQEVRKQEKVQPVVYKASLRPSTDPEKEKAKKDRKKETKKIEEEDPFNMGSSNEVSETKKQSNDEQSIGSDAEIIKAAVYGNQRVKQGGQLKMRLLQEATIEGVSYPRNTIFYGSVMFGTDRLLASIDRMPKAVGGYHKANLTIHESDMVEGIYAPVNPTKEVGSQQALNSSTTVLNSVTPMGLGSAASSIVRAAANGPVIVSVDDGRVIYLMPKQKGK